jgi:hypothetical protein
MKRLLAIFFLHSLINSGVASADELVSLDLVRQSSGSEDMRQAYTTSTPVIVGDRLELSSDSGYDFGLKVMRSTYSELGNRIINATTDAGGAAIFVVGKDGHLLGSITEMGERRLVSTSADGQRQINAEGYFGFEKDIDAGGAIDRARIPPINMQLELDELDVSASPYRVRKAERTSTVIYPTYKTGTAKISVLMYYDESMANASSTIDFVTQVANKAYADSGAKVEIEIVGTKALDIDDDASHSDLKSAMRDAEAPFEVIESDRSFFSADLVFLLRDTRSPDGEDPCGIASLGVYDQFHYRGWYTGLVEWNPLDSNTGGYYCSDYTFAHEVGHLLGAAHDRESIADDNDDDGDSDGDGSMGAAYSYSHGYKVGGVFRTVMGANGNSPAPRLGLFSSPELSCVGYPCGIVRSQSDSADTVSTFHSTGHLLASNEGEFAFEAISTWTQLGEYECTTTDDEAGYYFGAYIWNNSAFPVELASTHYKRPDGTFQVFDYEAGERVALSGSTAGSGFCTKEGEAPVFGEIFKEVFFRYQHPISGELVETQAVLSDDREYRTVRVASGLGGSVSGNPTQSVQLGSSKTFAFVPESGYEMAGIQSNCSGRKSGNRYTVDVDQDNCFVEATFEDGGSDLRVQNRFNSLLDTVEKTLSGR